MAFCGKCGTQISDGMKFCPSCGAAVQAEEVNQNTDTVQEQAHTQGTTQAGSAQAAGDIASKLQKLNDTADTTSEHDQNDIANNKVMAILAYLGFLVLIPIFAAPSSKFARFHANQGLPLFILQVAYGIVRSIIMAILRLIFPAELAWTGLLTVYETRGAFYNILSAVFYLPFLVLIVLAIIGIINAAQGKAKELPFIGKIRILK